MDIPYRRLVEVWFDAQVELHGQYSLARLDSLHAYSQRTPMWRVVLVSVLTPAIAILLITATDAIPLQDPIRGLGESQALWVRAFITICAVSGGAVFQLRIIVPKLEMSYIEATLLTLISSAAAVATQYGYAVAIGYPVPFGLILGTPSCFWLIVAGVTIPRRVQLRTRPQLRRDLKNYLIILICQINMTVIYPIYNYVFMKLSSTAQTAFVMLLPVIKLVNKNWLGHLLRDLDDMRPELVVFNVEVFHALYVSICMQSSTSIYTTIVIMAIDFLQAWLSLRDVNDILKEMVDLLAKLPRTGQRVSLETSPVNANVRIVTDPGSVDLEQHRKRNIIEAAAAVLQEDKTIRIHPDLRQTCFVSSTQSRRTSSMSTTAAAGRGPRLSFGQRTQTPVSANKNPDSIMRSTTVSAATKPYLSATIHPMNDDHGISTGPDKLPDAQGDTLQSPAPAHSLGLNAEERLRLVQKTAQILFFTEFVVLVEYAEVMIPVIYSTSCSRVQWKADPFLALTLGVADACTIGMVRLPNRAYYPQLAVKSDDELKRTFGNVSLYGTLEFISFVSFCLLLRYKLRYSVLTQVAFVLENQFVMVQAKLMMWVFYVIQTSLQHFGEYISFDFRAWL